MKQGIRAAAAYIIPALAGCLVALLLVVLIAGFEALPETVQRFWDGFIGSPFAVGATLAVATPIILTGLAASLSFRAGIFNLGQVGQVVTGAFAAGLVAPLLHGAPVFTLTASLIVGTLAGGLYGLLAGVVTHALHLNVTVATLLLNYLAEGMVTFLLSDVLERAPAQFTLATARLEAYQRLPLLVERTSLHAGVLLVPIVILIYHVWVTRTAAGHRLTLYGKNAFFGIFSGTHPVKFQAQVLFAGGALCGAAGAIQVLGVFGQYLDGSIGGATSPAWNGLTAAILGNAGTLSLLPAGLFLAALNTGLANVARHVGITSSVSLVIQAAILFSVAYARRPRQEPPLQALPISAAEREPRMPVQPSVLEVSIDERNPAV